MAARFWVGGAGTWDVAATANWAASSGGASGASAPTSSDDATFDANSGLGTGITVTIAGTAACRNLAVTGPAAKSQAFSLSGDFAPAGTITINGNSAINRLLVQSSVRGTARTITVASSPTLTNVDFQDIATAGAGGTWGGTSIGDCLGNSGITFTAAATQTHTASAGGNWSDATKWTSRVPLPQDDVVVNASTTGTLTVDMPRLGRNVSLSGFAGTLAWSASNASAFGNWHSGSATFTGQQSLTLAGRGAQTLTSNGVTFTNQLIVNAPGGTYTLQDALTSTRSLASALTVSAGTLDTANRAINLGAAGGGGGLSMTGGTLLLGTSTVTVASTIGASFWSVTGGTVSAANSTIVLSQASTTTRTFIGGGATYGTLTYTVAGSTGALVITGSNAFDTINFSDVTNARTLTFGAGSSQTIRSFQVSGTAAKLMSLVSDTPGTAWNLVFSGSGIVNRDYLSIQDSHASPSVTWFAGSNSTNVSGNTGWVFAVGIISTESAAATDVYSSVLASISETESVSGADAQSSVLASVPSADSATGADVYSSILASLSAAESVSAADVYASIMATVASADGGAIGEDLSQLRAAIAGADSGAAAENYASMIATLPHGDTVVGSDVEQALRAAISDSDGGTVTEHGALVLAASFYGSGQASSAELTAGASSADVTAGAAVMEA